LVFRSETLAIIDQVVVSAANFLAGAIIGRVCTKDEFGLYMLGLSVVFVVMGPQTALVSQPYTILSPRLQTDERARYTGSVLVHQLVISFVIAIGLAAIAVVLSKGDGYRDLAGVLSALALMISFILFKEFARNICFSNLNFKMAIVLDSIASFFQVLLLIVLALNGLLTSRLSFIVIGFSCLIGALSWIFNSRRNFSIIFTNIIPDFVNNWFLKKWLFFSVLIWDLGLHVYPWLLATFHGTETTGVFAACMGVVGIAYPVTIAVGNFIGPKISHSYAEQGASCLRNVAVKMVLRIALLMTPFCVFFFIFGGWIAVFVYGEKYVGVGFEIFLLSWNLFVTTSSLPLSRALHVFERTDLDFFVNIVPFIVMILVGIPLVRELGIVGAGFGMLLGNSLAAGVRFSALWRVTAASVSSSDGKGGVE
jgi:O-antigen/teichoic acid export membrane protein